jgi:hypothetical protein
MAASFQRLYVIDPTHAWIAEATAATPRAVPEKLVRCLWFDQRWRPSALWTLDGKPLIVHAPGRWNLHAGPDFQHAVIEFPGGERRRGDVEVHRYASGWTAHRHHLDPRYNQVILHVCLWNDRHLTEVRCANGQAVPQVALTACLPRPLAAYQDDVVLEDYPYKSALLPGQCYAALRTLALADVQQFLDSAGDARLQQRMRRWSRRAAEVGLEQTMYEAVWRSLGSTGHRQHFQMLARLVGWQELQDCLRSVPAAARGLAAEALLLGLAGILQQVGRVHMALDGETQHYVETLQAYWTRFPGHITQRAWHNVHWRQPHVRPANTPERRLAAMAWLLTRYHGTNLMAASLELCSACTGQPGVPTPRMQCQALARLFDLPATSYWARRVRLGGRKGKVQRLIGAQRALTVVIDAVLPVLLLQAHNTGNTALYTSLMACYRDAPRLPDNHLLRYMARRLLGSDAALLALVTGARQQQGVLQIFYDFCDNDEGNCQGCDFPLVAAPASIDLQKMNRKIRTGLHE